VCFVLVSLFFFVFCLFAVFDFVREYFFRARILTRSCAIISSSTSTATSNLVAHLQFRARKQRSNFAREGKANSHTPPTIKTEEQKRLSETSV